MRILISILILFIVSCNPIKSVLKDKEKLDKVAEVVIRSGYCANDTIINYKSDTTYHFDTLYEYSTDTITNRIEVPKIQKVFKTIVKTITIRDTIKSVITDNARIKLLERDYSIISEKYRNTQELAKSRLKWLILLLIAFVVYLFRKKLINVI